MCWQYIDISKWLDFRVFSDKDVETWIVVTSDPYQSGNSLLGNPLTNEWERADSIAYWR
jgi:hypothetical protein